MSFLSSLFPSYSARQIKKISVIADKIDALADRYSAMSDQELKSQTDIFRARLAKGETTDDILPEAFAVVREVADRVLGKRPFRVQLLAGIVLHQGRIAEMKTGEGKTLMATLPAYLNALSGNGVHVGRGAELCSVGRVAGHGDDGGVPAREGVGILGIRLALRSGRNFHSLTVGVVTGAEQCSVIIPEFHQIRGLALLDDRLCRNVACLGHIGVVVDLSDACGDSLAVALLADTRAAVHNEG